MTKSIDKKTMQKLDNARINMKIAVALSDLAASEISTRAGLSQNVLGKYLRGETMIAFGNMQAVCDILGIPLALITSAQQISPARIRLHRILDRMTEGEIALFIEQQQSQNPEND